MVKSLTELNLLVVGINILTEGFRLTEIEGGTFYFQNLTCRDSSSICRQIEVCIDLTDLILDCRVGSAAPAKQKKA